jgi:hypothetical protein
VALFSINALAGDFAMGMSLCAAAGPWNGAMTSPWSMVARELVVGVAP